MTDKQTIIVAVCAVAVVVALVLIARMRSGPRVTIIDTKRDEADEQ